MSKLPTIGPRHTEFDIEQPPPSTAVAEPLFDLAERMPRLTDPSVIAAMRSAVSEVSQARSVLKTIGNRPDHETVDTARKKLAEVESQLSKELEEIVLTPRPSEVERMEWRAELAEKEKERREKAERERRIYKAVISLDEMHEAYERMVREAEAKLARIYEAAVEGRGGGEEESEGDAVVEEVNEEVVGVLQEGMGKGIERVDLSNRRLRLLPEAFGRLRGLVVLNLANNQLEAIPDSIGGLEHLEELYLASNLLDSLPDSIGLLFNLKILDVSGNKLVSFPDSICQCRSLVELDASFNRLAYLPTNIGFELVKLRRLSIQLNKLRSLPTSICEMTNFSDLTELPDTLGDLSNLKELDLSNNQIHALPDTFGRLDKLTKLNLEENPLVIPPKEVVSEGVEAIKIFMAKRWLDILVEEERRSMLEVQEPAQTGWLTRSLSRSTSWMSTVASGVSGYVRNAGKSTIDPYLDQQL
ncbi:hypothetical protein C3L33_14380, partial [Rhododendron williamsianum]